MPLVPAPLKRRATPLLLQSDLHNWDLGHATLCFPCVIDAAHLRPDPLDRYYLYYAAHAGNGIGLATAPAPLGPWTPYPGNPVLGLRDAPGFRGHISSPEIARLGGRVALYFHGPHERYPGQHTGVALSDDGGRSFRVDPRSPVLIAPGGAHWQGYTRSYMRVFGYRGEYYGLYMGHPRAEFAAALGDPQVIQRAGLVRSSDGVDWRSIGGAADGPTEPLFGPEAAFGESTSVRHSGIHAEGARVYLFYSSPHVPEGPAPPVPEGEAWRRLHPERLHAALLEVSGRPERLQLRLHKRGPLLEGAFPWERATLRDPCPLVVGDRLYLYYVGGGEVAYGVAVYDWPALRRFLETGAGG